MQEELAGIYCIENLINGKKYVGQGKDIKKRMYQYHKNSHVLNKAIKKYGNEGFSRYVLCYCDDENRRSLLETYFIVYLGSHVSDGGYNISWGGISPMTGRVHPQKWRKNHSERMSGENHPFWGTHRSIETKALISLSNIGKSRSNETKIKMSLSAKKRIHTKEENDKISLSTLGKQRGKKKSKTSSYLGVSKRECRRKFCSQITYEQIVFRLGNYYSEIDAAKAYDSAAFFLYGKNATLNFPYDYNEKGE
jgi:group I intron endonuclease